MNIPARRYDVHNYAKDGSSLIEIGLSIYDLIERDYVTSFESSDKIEGLCQGEVARADKPGFHIQRMR